MSIFLKNRFIILVVFFMAMISIFYPNLASADIWQNITASDQGGLEDIGQNVFGDKNPKQMGEIVASIINYLFSFLGVIFIVLTVYAGFLWMTAAGESDKVDTAKSILVNASIGLAITLSSYAISYFIIKNMIRATGN